MKTTRPERLSVDDRYFLFAIINALANRIQMAGDSLCEEVTWKQSFAMLALSVYASPPSISQLAEMIGTSHQNMKQLLLRLQKAEFVILEKNPADKRQTLVRFSQKFFDFESKYREASVQFIEEIYEGISDDDIRTARHVLETIDANLKTLSEDKGDRQ